MPVAYDAAYRLDAGDRLRIVVYGQEGLTNTYAIDAGGSITMPLIGAVRARGLTPAGLAAEITGKLRNGYIREPSVAVEIEAYRPFFILGEVAAPGQYPYVPNMSVESAVAIAGGFSPRARRDRVTLTHTDAGGSDPRQWCRSAPRSAPAIPCSSANAGSDVFVSRARCGILHAASQNRDRTKHRAPLRPRLCSSPFRKCYTLRCVRGTISTSSNAFRLFAKILFDGCAENALLRWRAISALTLS